MLSETKKSETATTKSAKLPIDFAAKPLTCELVPKWRESILTRGQAPKFPTGIAALDDVIWGVHPDEVTVIAARPSHGKTSLATQIAWNLASKTGGIVIFFSLEMSTPSIIERMFCHDQQVSGYRLRKGQLPDNFEERYENFKAKMEAIRLEVVDYAGRTKEEIAQFMEWALSSKSAVNPIVIVDHVQMCSARGFASKQEAIEEYMRSLLDMSIKYHASIIALSQINRPGAGANGLEFLKGSGSLEETASCVINCKWASRCPTGTENHNDDQTLYYADVEKQRHGPTQRVQLNFDAEHFTFSARDQSPVFSGKSKQSDWFDRSNQ